MRWFEYLAYGTATLLGGWFAPRIFVSTKWERQTRAMFAVIATIGMFIVLGAYHLNTGKSFNDVVETYVLCPIYSFPHCPSVLPKGTPVQPPSRSNEHIANQSPIQESQELAGEQLKTEAPAERTISGEQKGLSPLTSNKANGRYQDHGDGTVTDTKTGLQWQRCSVGQRWTESTCVGKASRVTKNEKDEKTTWPEFAGHSDWRVPQELNLSTLVYCSSGKPEMWRYSYLGWHPCEGSYQRPTIDQVTFPNTPSHRFWATKFDFVDFSLGRNGFSSFGGGGNYVRLVRGTYSPEFDSLFRSQLTRALVTSPQLRHEQFATPRVYCVLPEDGLATINVRSGPGINFPVVEQLHRGVQVTGISLTSGADGYNWIRLMDGERYIYDVLLAPILPDGRCQVQTITR